jgi:hypothetical protein
MTAKLPQIKARICDAFGPGELALHLHTLALRVFPEEHFPNAMRYPSRGGPPGCYMALSRALNEMGVRRSTCDWNLVLRPSDSMRASYDI